MEEEVAEVVGRVGATVTNAFDRQPLPIQGSGSVVGAVLVERAILRSSMLQEALAQTPPSYTRPKKMIREMVISAQLIAEARLRGQLSDVNALMKRY